MVDQSRETSGDGDRSEPQNPGSARTAESVDGFTVSIIRVVLAFVGLVLFLYAVGRAVGVDPLAVLGEILATRIGRWLLLAVFALILVLVALRGFGTPAERR